MTMPNRSSCILIHIALTSIITLCQAWFKVPYRLFLTSTCTCRSLVEYLSFNGSSRVSSKSVVLLNVFFFIVTCYVALGPPFAVNVSSPRNFSSQSIYTPATANCLIALPGDVTTSFITGWDPCISSISIIFTFRLAN